MKRLFNYKSWFKSINESFIKMEDINVSSDYTNVKTGKTTNKGYGSDIVGDDMIRKFLIDDINEAAKRANVRCVITCGKNDHPSTSWDSRHFTNSAVDIALVGYDTTDFSRLPGSGGATKQRTDIVPEFVNAGNKLVEQLILIGYKLLTHDPILKQKFASSIAYGEKGNPRAILWRGDWERGGNHYNHIHISNTSDEPSNNVPQADVLASINLPQIPEPETVTTGQFGTESVKIYTSKGDPYIYCVKDGIWYSKEGPQNKKGSWEYFQDWTSLEKNCRANEILDNIHIGARTTSEIELNRQKYCSFQGDVEKNRKEWLESIGGTKSSEPKDIVL